MKRTVSFSQCVRSSFLKMFFVISITLSRCCVWMYIGVAFRKFVTNYRAFLQKPPVQTKVRHATILHNPMSIMECGQIYTYIYPYILIYPYIHICRVEPTGPHEHNPNPPMAAITMIWGWPYICSVRGFHHRSSWFEGPDNSKKSWCDTRTKMFTRRTFESDGEFLQTIGFEQKTRTSRWSCCGVCTTSAWYTIYALGYSAELTTSVTVSNFLETPQNEPAQ